MLVYALASMVVRPVCLCAAAKELLISIMSFEGMIVIEACIETWDLAGRSWMQASHRFGLGEAAYGPILIAGDSFFFVSVLNLRHERSWASAMLIPCTAFFGLACGVTMLSLGIKLHLIYKKLTIGNDRDSSSKFAQIVPLPEAASQPSPLELPAGPPRRYVLDALLGSRGFADRLPWALITRPCAVPPTKRCVAVQLAPFRFVSRAREVHNGHGS